MTNGGIVANGPVRSVATSATDGSLVSFITTSAPPERAPAQIFCAVVRSSFYVQRTLLTIVSLQPSNGEHPVSIRGFSLESLLTRNFMLYSILTSRFTDTTIDGSYVRGSTDQI